MDRTYTGGGSKLRNEWEFEYTARDVAKAAAEQRDYRLSRQKVWEEKKEEVMIKVRESGLTIHESIAEKLSSASYSNAAHGAAQVLVDPTLQKDLNECATKIHTHRELAAEYAAWVQILEANPESRLKLRHGDWMFFFGK